MKMLRERKSVRLELREVCRAKSLQPREVLEGSARGGGVGIKTTCNPRENLIPGRFGGCLCQLGFQKFMNHGPASSSKHQ